MMRFYMQHVVMRDRRKTVDNATTRSDTPEEGNSRRNSCRWSRVRCSTCCCCCCRRPSSCLPSSLTSSSCTGVISAWSGFPWVPPARAPSACVAALPALCSDSPPPPRHGRVSPLQCTHTMRLVMDPPLNIVRI